MFKSISLACLFLIGAVSLNAQKAKKGYAFDDDILSKDGVALFKLTKSKSNMHLGYNDVTISSLDGERLIFCQVIEFADPAVTTTGKSQYYEMTFLDNGGKTEVRWYMKMKNFAEMLADNNLIKDGELDSDAVQQFILINGAKYSKRRAELNPTNQTIIINQQQPAPQNGLNLNLNIKN